jgi:dextranase
MLSDEYFPSDHKKRMDPELQAAVQRMYDFITAYENLLRDGQKPVCRTVLVDEYDVSENGRADTIWCFGKADAGHEIIHFINLVGTDNEWRDTQQTKKAPVLLHDLRVRLYTDFAAQSVSLASPDNHDISLRELDYSTETDLEGRYILFDIPSLAYWDMILLR